MSLLTVSNVAAMLATTPGAARTWLARNGVSLIQLGRGRGLGARYRKEEVEAAISGATITPQEPTKPIARRPQLETRPLYGRSLAEQTALVMGGRVQ